MCALHYIEVRPIVDEAVERKLTAQMYAAGYSRLDDYVAELLRYHAEQEESPLAKRLYHLPHRTKEEWEGIGGVYQILNTELGRSYIGSAVNLRDRIREHSRHLRAGTHHNRHIQSDFTLQQDEGSFRVNILEVVATPEPYFLRIREQVWLERARVVYGPRRIYNLATPYAGDTSNTPSVPRPPGSGATL